MGLLSVDWQWERNVKNGKTTCLSLDIIPLGVSYFQVKKMQTWYIYFLLWVFTINNDGEPLLWWEWLKQNVRWLRWWWKQ